MQTKEEEEDLLHSYMTDFKRLAKWKPMALFLRFGAPLMGIVYLIYAALLIYRGDLVLEVWFLPWI